MEADSFLWGANWFFGCSSWSKKRLILELPPSASDLVSETKPFVRLTFVPSVQAEWNSRISDNTPIQCRPPGFVQNTTTLDKTRSVFAVFLSGTFAKLRKAITGFVISVRLHGTTHLPLDEFLWNLIFEYFSKICRENLSSIKNLTGIRVIYMKT